MYSKAGVALPKILSLDTRTKTGLARMKLTLNKNTTTPITIHNTSSLVNHKTQHQ